jgi:two-component system chemotaxis response regulator CheB
LTPSILPSILTQGIELDVELAEDQSEIHTGRIYIAPPDRHLLIEEGRLRLSQGPKENLNRPAVDPLFRSASEIWGNAVLAVILTGMGHDGTKGAADIVAQGGSVIAQDEASSVVWGMPGSAANASVCSAVLPIDQIAPKLLRMFQGDRA